MSRDFMEKAALLGAAFVFLLVLWALQFRYTYFKDDQIIYRVDRLTQEVSRSRRGNPFSP